MRRVPRAIVNAIPFPATTRLLAAIPVVAVLLLSACSSEDSDPDPYPGQATPAGTLRSLEAAWNRGDHEKLPTLLADDFIFRVHPAFSEREGFSQWGRPEEVELSELLFTAPTLQKITVELGFGPDQPVNETGREDQRRIDVYDTFVEVSEKPFGDETWDFRVDGDRQRFYFRRGRSDADTLDGSPTADLWFVVDWSDLGGTAAPGHPVDQPTPVQAITWTELKLLHGDPEALATRLRAAGRRD